MTITTDLAVRPASESARAPASQAADVVILGGGLVGLTLALALHAHGLTSIVIDTADPVATLKPGFDGRASAVASASWNMLRVIGVADRLEGQGCPIRTIQVSDGPAGPGAIARGLAFDAAPDDAPLGIMFENRQLRFALREAALAASGITLMQPARPVATHREPFGARVTLDDGRTATAPLLIAAEGRASPTREAAGLRIARWHYHHHAIIGGILHEYPHGGVAHEIFYPSGPFAILPMRDDGEGRHRSAIVWTVADRDGPAMLALPDRAFVAEAEKRMAGLLGRIAANGSRAAYPLGFHHAAKITADRLALIGDAAHGIHPIAGQGLNLGFRDVAALTEVLVDGARLGLDLGDAQLMARYESWRALDTFMVAAATDGLTRLFGLPGRAPAAARRLGLAAVARIAPLRRRFMAEARGESGDLPALLSGMRV